MSGPDDKTLRSFMCSLGFFHARFNTLDTCTDFAIFRSLDVTAYQAHLITSGLMFGRKGRLLTDLLKAKDTKASKKLLGAFNKARGNSKRDIIAHGYHYLGVGKVTFVERSISGAFKAKSHEFTMREFADYCVEFSNAVEEFIALLGAPEEIDAFGSECLAFSDRE